MKRHAAPIIAAVLLLLPVLYVGSYLALVNPRGLPVTSATDYLAGREPSAYRIGGVAATRIFWPLEQIDRKVRPGAWGGFSEKVREQLRY